MKGQKKENSFEFMEIHLN